MGIALPAWMVTVVLSESQDLLESTGLLHSQRSGQGTDIGHLFISVYEEGMGLVCQQERWVFG